MAVHEIKIAPKFFEYQKNGKKKWELRKNDRDYKVGDTLILKEFRDGENQYYTGRMLSRVITYILPEHEGLTPGYVILGTDKL